MCVLIIEVKTTIVEISLFRNFTNNGMQRRNHSIDNNKLLHIATHGNEMRDK